MWLTCVRGQTHFACLIHRLYAASCHVAPNNPRVHFRGGAEGKITAIFPSKKYVESCFCGFFPPSSLIPFMMDLFMLAKVFFFLSSLAKTQNSLSEKSSKFPSDNSCCNLYVIAFSVCSQPLNILTSSAFPIIMSTTSNKFSHCRPKGMNE